MPTTWILDGDGNVRYAGNRHRVARRHLAKYEDPVRALRQRAEVAENDASSQASGRAEDRRAGSGAASPAGSVAGKTKKKKTKRPSPTTASAALSSLASLLAPMLQEQLSGDGHSGRSQGSRASVTSELAASDAPSQASAGSKRGAAAAELTPREAAAQFLRGPLSTQLPDAAREFFLDAVASAAAGEKRRGAPTAAASGMRDAPSAPPSVVNLAAAARRYASEDAATDAAALSRASAEAHAAAQVRRLHRADVDAMPSLRARAALLDAARAAMLHYTNGKARGRDTDATARRAVRALHATYLPDRVLSTDRHGVAVPIVVYLFTARPTPRVARVLDEEAYATDATTLAEALATHLSDAVGYGPSGVSVDATAYLAAPFRGKGEAGGGGRLAVGWGRRKRRHDATGATHSASRGAYPRGAGRTHVCNRAEHAGDRLRSRWSTRGRRRLPVV